MGRSKKGATVGVSLMADLPPPVSKPYKDEAKQEFRAWLMLPEAQRKPGSKSALARKLKVDISTLWRWEQGNGHIAIEDLSIEEKIKFFDKILFGLVRNPKTPSKDRELFAKRYGLLVDKSINIEVKVDADEIARRNFEADRELQEWRSNRGTGRHRVEEV